MSLKMLVSPVAIAAAAAFTFGSAAYAQTMVGTQEISDADLPIVQAHCEALAGASVDVPTETLDDDAMLEDGATDDAATDDIATDLPVGDLEGDVDLEAILFEDCQAAGLVD